MYNAINFFDTPYGAINSTAESVGLAMLWCPSDGTISGLKIFMACAGWDGTTVPITYGSYAGMIGNLHSEVEVGRVPTVAEMNLENGMYPDVGAPAPFGNPAHGQGTRSPVKIANITDGTSNTIAFAEHVTESTPGGLTVRRAATMGRSGLVGRCRLRLARSRRSIPPNSRFQRPITRR